jgi:hypothetical protein
MTVTMPIIAISLRIEMKRNAIRNGKRHRGSVILSLFGITGFSRQYP